MANDSFEEVCITLLRLFLGAVLVFSGVLHASKPFPFAVSISEYQLFSPLTVSLATTLIPLTQIFLGVLLISDVWIATALLGTLMLSGLSTAGLIALNNGSEISCGCFGKYSPQLTYIHVACTFVLSVLSAIGSYRSIDRSFNSELNPSLNPRSQLTGSRHGFSLIELVCVVAIIGVLVAMLLPAVQAVRESARNTSCKDKLKQIGFALLNYESSHQRFPPGTLGFKKTVTIQESDFSRWDSDPSFRYYLQKNQNTSWIAFLLPFVDENSKANQLPKICTNSTLNFLDYQNNYSGFGSLLDVPEVVAVMGQNLPAFQCPSDNLTDATPQLGGSQPCYVLDTGEDVFLAFFTKNKVLASTNYGASAGAHSSGELPKMKAPYNGMFTSRIRRELRDVRDGTSNSVAVGEVLGMIENKTRVHTNSWLFAPLVRARSDLSWESDYSFNRPGLEILGDDWFAFSSGYGAKHPQSVNFLFVDGSVHSISREADWLFHYQISGIQDGETIAFK